MLSGVSWANMTLRKITLLFRAQADIKQIYLFATISLCPFTYRRNIMSTVKRGEIYYADLSPAIGSEQGGIRPVVIVQNDIGNYYSPTTIIAPITSRIKTIMPTHVLIDNPCLNKKSIILLEQIRIIDKSRLREYLGVLKEYELNEVDKAMEISLDVGSKKGELL